MLESNSPGSVRRRFRFWGAVARQPLGANAAEPPVVGIQLRQEVLANS